MADTREVMEWRRMRALELKAEGWTQRAIAAALGVTEGAVSQWFKRAAEGGAAALKARVSSGRPRALTDEQLARLPELLAQGAEAFGFRGDVWTAQRVARLIQREFGVKYHRSHVNWLLHEAGWTVQKPVKRATQQDEAEIQRWIDERWPALKKSPTTRAG